MITNYDLSVIGIAFSGVVISFSSTWDSGTDAEDPESSYKPG